MDRNQQYKANKEAKVGETIICPVCGRAFVKKQYSVVITALDQRFHKRRCHSISPVIERLGLIAYAQTKAM